MRRLNDLVHAVQQSRKANTPAAFGVVEPHHGDAALPEIDRIADELKMAGLVWRHQNTACSQNVPVMTRFVARAAERGLLPMLHVTPLSGNETLWRVWHLAEQFPQVPMVALGAFSNWDQAGEAANPELRTESALRHVGSCKRARITWCVAARLGPDRLVFGSGATARRTPRFALRRCRSTHFAEQPIATG